MPLARYPQQNQPTSRLFLYRVVSACVIAARSFRPTNGPQREPTRPCPRLTDTTIKTARIGEHSDAQTPGLSFIVRASTAKATPKPKRRIWTYRFTLDGKRQKMGLGAYPAVDLAEARRNGAKPRPWSLRACDPRLARRETPKT